MHYTAEADGIESSGTTVLLQLKSTMPKSIYQMTIAELVERGWTIIYDDDTGEPTAVRSVIDQWNKLTWAKQIYYRGKYGFDEDGILEILLVGQSSTNRIALKFYRDLFPDEFVTPDGKMPGSNDRLRSILERSRIRVEDRKYDDTALVHTGPDNSLILTNEAGWGPPYTETDTSYVELDDKYTCYWETGPSWVPEAPCWTCPECNGL